MTSSNILLRLQVLHAKAFIILSSDINKDVSQLCKFLSILYAASALVEKGKTSKIVNNLLPVYKEFSKEFIANLGLTRLVDQIVQDILTNDTKKASEHLKTIGDKLWEKRTIIQKAFSNNFYNLLNNARLFAQKRTPASYNNFDGNVVLLHSPAVADLFTRKVVVTPNREDYVRAQELVYKLTGRKNSTVIVSSEKRLLALDKKKEFILKEYYALMRKAKVATNEYLKYIVRDSMEHYVPLVVVHQLFKESGLLLNTLPPVFDANIGEDGQLYTKTGSPLRSNVTQEYTPIHNPNYDPEKDDTSYAKLQPIVSDMQPAYLYTHSYSKDTKSEKTTNVNTLIENIVEIRKKWLQDLRINDLSSKREAVLATILETVFQTSGRIGSEKGSTKRVNEAGEIENVETLGVSVWRCKNLKFTDSKVTVDYLGKKAMEQSHEIDSEKLVSALRKLCANKKPDSFVFTFKGDRVTEGNVNTYFKLLAGQGIQANIHLVRSVKGTILFNKLVKEKGLKIRSLTDKEAAGEFKNIAIQVAELLGHKNAKGDPAFNTSVKSYINPEASIAFFKKLGNRLPPYLQTSTGVTLERPILDKDLINSNAKH